MKNYSPFKIMEFASDVVCGEDIYEGGCGANSSEVGKHSSSRTHGLLWAVHLPNWVSSKFS